MVPQREQSLWAQARHHFLRSRTFTGWERAVQRHACEDAQLYKKDEFGGPVSGLLAFE